VELIIGERKLCELLLQIKYTQGDMEVAQKYFGQAIKLNSNNMRALFGYYLVRTSCDQQSAVSNLSFGYKAQNRHIAEKTNYITLPTAFS